MARKANGANVNGHAGAHEPDDATLEHSVEARRDAIIKAMHQTYMLDGKIDASIERNVKPFREDKADIKSKLHDKFGITAQQFNARYNLYRLERRAEESDDNITLDVMREMFEYLPAGKSVDLVEAAEEATRRRGSRSSKGQAAEDDRPSA